MLNNPQQLHSCGYAREQICSAGLQLNFGELIL